MARILAAAAGIMALGIGGLVATGQGIVAPGDLPISRAVGESPVAANDAQDLKTATLRVSKMDCPSCAYILRRTLEGVDGVAAAKVSYGAQTAVVTYDPARCDTDRLVAATASVGFPSAVIE